MLCNPGSGWVCVCLEILYAIEDGLDFLNSTDPREFREDIIPDALKFIKLHS